MILEIEVAPDAREGEIEKFTVFADLATFMLHKVLFEVAGQYQVVQLFDYHEVSGLQIPFSRITSQSYSNGEPRRILMETVIREIEFNVFLDDGIFTKPPAPPVARWKPSTGG